MFTKWNKKEVLTFIICFAVFFALVLATQLPGFASPLYWAMFPALSAFVADEYEARLWLGSSDPAFMVHSLSLPGRVRHAANVGLDTCYDGDRRDHPYVYRL